MVQVIQPRDIGGEMGQAIGGGFGDAMKLLGQGDLTKSAIDELSNLNTEGMNEQQIYANVAKATRYSPHLQKQAGEISDRLYKQEKARAFQKTQEDAAKLREEQLRLRNQGITGPGGTPTEGGVSPEQGAIVQGAQGGTGDPLATPGDLRELPLMEEQAGMDLMPTQEEIQTWVGPFTAVGDTEGARDAFDKLIASKQSQRDARIEDARLKREEQTARRSLETELAQNVLSKTKNLLKQKGMTTGGDPIVDEQGNITGREQVVDEKWNRLAYNYFQDERKKQPKASDEKLWQDAGLRVERKINDIATAGAKHYRPTWEFNKERRAESARKWAKDHLKAYGNTAEDRELLKTVMMDNAWTREEATAIVQPASDSLESAYRKVKGVPPQQMPGRPDQMGAPQQPRPVRFDEFREKIVPELKKSFRPEDSLFLLKSRLVNNKGLTDDEAIIVINEMQGGEDGVKLQPHQITEQNYLQENIRPSPYDLFFGDKRAVEIMRPLIK